MPTKTKTAAEPVAVDELPLVEDAIDDTDYDNEEFDDEEGDEFDDEEGEPEAEPAIACPAPLVVPEQPTRLTGDELLAFYAQKKEAGRTHAEIAYDAGYYSVTANGQERVALAKFNEAYLEAQGIETGGKASGGGRNHAGFSKARVSGQGILLVSQLATRHVGADPGTVFTVTFPEPGKILLEMTDEIKPVIPRKRSTDEQPGTPLLDGAQAA